MFPELNSSLNESYNVSELAGSLFLTQLLLTAATTWATDGRNRSSNTIRSNYDYIVVGGGAAGSVIAARLAENPKISVLLLEAGGSTSDESDMPALYQGLVARPTSLIRDIWTEPQPEVCRSHPQRRCNIKLGNIIGGGASVNSLIWDSQHFQRFSRWQNGHGLNSWSLESIMPYVNRVENRLERPRRVASMVFGGSGGKIKLTTENWTPLEVINRQFVKAGRELGYPSLMYQPVLRNVHHGRRMGPDHAYIRPIESDKSKTLHIVMLASVTKVLFDRKRAIGVQFVRDGRYYEINADREVILSAGALVTPQLLMLSGIGPANHLRNHSIPIVYDSPEVGRNLHDVLWCNLNFTTNYTFPADGVIDQKAVEKWRLNGTGVLTGSMMGSGTFLNYKTSEWFFDIKSLVILAYDTIDAQRNQTKNFTWQAVTFQTTAQSRGHVQLRSTDPSDDPIVDPKYMTHEVDRENVVQSLLDVLKLMSTKTFRSYGVKLAKPTDPEVKHCEAHIFWPREYMDCISRHVCQPSYVMAGTARMGTDDRSVVDERLRVRGVTGLRVADNSIVPRDDLMSSMAIAMIIGEKAADMIAEDNLDYTHKPL